LRFIWLHCGCSTTRYAAYLWLHLQRCLPTGCAFLCRTLRACRTDRFRSRSRTGSLFLYVHARFGSPLTTFMVHILHTLAGSLVGQVLLDGCFHHVCHSPPACRFWFRFLFGLSVWFAFSAFPSFLAFSFFSFHHHPHAFFLRAHTRTAVCLPRVARLPGSRRLRFVVHGSHVYTHGLHTHKFTRFRRIRLVRLPWFAVLRFHFHVALPALSSPFHLSSFAFTHVRAPARTWLRLQLTAVPHLYTPLTGSHTRTYVPVTFLCRAPVTRLRTLVLAPRGSSFATHLVHYTAQHAHSHYTLVGLHWFTALVWFVRVRINRFSRTFGSPPFTFSH